jgi:hypothetical protein
MSGKPKNKGSSGKKTATRGKSAVKQYAAKGLKKADRSFHIKLKHVLGGISLLSLLAAFEVFSIPAASGIIELFVLTKFSAAEVWFGTAVLTGFSAVYLYLEEQENDI